MQDIPALSVADTTRAVNRLAYVIDYFRAIQVFALAGSANLFDRLPRTKWYRSALADFLAQLKPVATDTLLDVGCGAGWNVLWASKQVRHAVGLDRSASMIKQANLNLSTGNYDNVSFVKGDVMNMPFRDRVFDLVTGTMLLPVLPNPQQALEEMLRVLRPGGKLGLFVPSASLTSSNAKQYAAEQGLRGFDRNSLITWSLVGKRFSEADVQNLFSTAQTNGFETHALLGGMAIAVIIEKR